MVSIRLVPYNELASNLDTLKILLAHKPELTLWLLDEILTKPDVSLKLDAAIAFDNNEWIGNIGLYHYLGIGLIGNVFLKEFYRGQGIGSRMMEQLDKFADENKHHTYVLWVDPKKKAAAYNMYKKSGYIPQGRTGLMIKDYSDIDLYAETTALHHTPMSWKHFPHLNLISSRGNCDIIISYLYHCFGFATFESEFLNYMNDPETEGWALEREDGFPVGAFFLRQDPDWEQQRDAKYKNNNYLFDIIIENRHTPFLPEILKTFPFPKGRITTYVNVPGPKYEALKNIFKQACILPDHFTRDKKSYDVALLFLDA